MIIPKGASFKGYMKLIHRRPNAVCYRYPNAVLERRPGVVVFWELAGAGALGAGVGADVNTSLG